MTGHSARAVALLLAFAAGVVLLRMAALLFEVGI